MSASTTLIFRNDETGHEIKATMSGNLEDGSKIDISINFGNKSVSELLDENNFKLLAILIETLNGEIQE